MIRLPLHRSRSRGTSRSRGASRTRAACRTCGTSRTRAASRVPVDRRPRDERGAVAVETAIVAIFLFGLAGGVVDVSMLIRTGLEVSSAARAGARTASADPLGATFAQAAATQAADAVRELPPNRVTRIWVYKADPATGQPVSGASCSSACVRFTVDGSGAAVYAGGSWTGRSACAGGTVDGVGVLVEYRHRASVSLFDGKLVTETAVMRLEQVPSTNVCVSS